MDFAEFQSRMVPVKPDPPLEGLALDLYQSNAMNGEAGEVANVVKKMARDGESEALDLKLLDESGDTIFYLTRLLERRGYTLEDAAQYLLDKLEQKRRAQRRPQ